MKDIGFFLDIEKEIRWINSVAQKGYRLVKREGFTYYFEEAGEGEYIYQVEKRKLSSDRDDEEYIEFLSSLGINKVTSKWGWCYFEKKNDGKSFEIYTDTKSKISHYKRIIKTFAIVIFVSICIISSTLNEPIGSRGPYILDIALKGSDRFSISLPIVFNSFLILVMSFAIAKYGIRIIKLRKDKLDME